MAIFLVSVGPPLLALLWRFIWNRMTSNNRLSPLMGPESYFNRKQLPDDKTFPQFTSLGEDIMIHILSFVADAPFESNHTVTYASSLTHGFPLVSKQLRRLAKTDSFWMDALVRQVVKEPDLWFKGLVSVAGQRGGEITDAANNTTEMVELVRQSLGVSSCDLYRLVLNTTIRITGPVFCMYHPVKLGEPYGLHFFEPRYRRLIADVMAPFPDQARQGGAIECEPGQSPPVFIHVHGQPVTRSAPACLVQVIRCRIYPGDGRADVFLLPIAFLRIETIWERPHTGHLFYARCIRVSRRETEILANQSLEAEEEE